MRPIVDNGCWAWLWIGFLFMALMLAFQRHLDPFPKRAELAAKTLGLSREWGLARSHSTSVRGIEHPGSPLRAAGGLLGAAAGGTPTEDLWGLLSVRELRLLPGLGDTRARALVRAREELEPGDGLPRLSEIPGIGEITERRVHDWLREKFESRSAHGEPSKYEGIQR